MKITDLIDKLQTQLDQHGDLEVKAEMYDSGANHYVDFTVTLSAPGYRGLSDEYPPFVCLDLDY